MKPECAQAIAKALGREMTEKELAAVESGISKSIRQLGAQDPQAVLAMSAEDRFKRGAQMAAEAVQAEARLKVKRAALSIKAADRIQRFALTKPDLYTALDSLLAFKSDGKAGVQSIESQHRAIRDQALGKMLEVFDAAQGKAWGLFSNIEGVRAIVKELHGQDSGNPQAKAAAKSFAEVSESLRTRFNSSGGKIGMLEDWGMPHSHSQRAIAKAGAEKWIADVMPLLKRDRYTNDDGSRMNDTDLQAFLGNAYLTIATDGASKIQPGQAHGSGMRANSGSESRQIHFADGDAYLKYQQAYGDKDLLGVLVGHVDRAARDIALLETLGPNPQHLMTALLDQGQKDMSSKNPLLTDKIEGKRKKLEALYKDASGMRDSAPSQALAEGFDTYRSLNVASKLGGAVLTSITDQGVLSLTAHMNKMPIAKALANEMRMLNPLDAGDRRAAQRAGLGINQMLGTLHRFNADGLGGQLAVSSSVAKYSQAIASKVLGLSGMNAWTAASQRGFAVTMLDTIGDMTRRHESLYAMDPHDAKRLRGAGITDTDWSIWRMATPEDWRGVGDTVLTGDAIYKISDESLAALALETGQTPQQLRDRAATMLLGHVLDETSMAIIEPGARERVLMHSGVQRGTWKGEITRSFWQFKSFSVSMLSRHWQRGMAQETLGGRVGYQAAMIGITTALGAMAVQMSDVASGKDPRDMTEKKFWLAAFLKGGALGLYGDFAFGDQTSYGSSALAALGGPIASDFEATIKIGQEMRNAAAEGRPPEAGAQTVKFLKGHLPAANLWYTKAATDHLIFNKLQDMFSPGYSKRMEGRSKKQFGQDWWWRPGSSEPARAPDLAAAVGE